MPTSNRKGNCKKDICVVYREYGEFTNMFIDRWSYVKQRVGDKVKSWNKALQIVFFKKIVDELLALTIDFAYSSVDIMGRNEYKEIFAGKRDDFYQRQIYCDTIIPERYDRIENILGAYLDLP